MNNRFPGFEENKGFLLDFILSTETVAIRKLDNSSKYLSYFLRIFLSIIYSRFSYEAKFSSVEVANGLDFLHLYRKVRLSIRVKLMDP